MLTFFTIPKGFRNHIGMIQRNAIASWGCLPSKCRIILFGEEEGTASVAREFSAHHVSEIARNDCGTPLVNDLFAKALHLSSDEFLCFINSDIILMSDFLRALEQVRHLPKSLLMIGQCWNVPVKQPLNFADPDWENRLRHLCQQQGEMRGNRAMDYLLFSRSLYGQLPPFAIGRAGFDNWLVWRALNLKANVVDATPVVTAIHQDHDYGHISGGKMGAYRGQEALRNREIAGHIAVRFGAADATHRLEATGLKPNLARYVCLVRRLHRYLRPSHLPFTKRTQPR